MLLITLFLYCVSAINSTCFPVFGFSHPSYAFSQLTVGSTIPDEFSLCMSFNARQTDVPKDGNAMIVGYTHFGFQYYSVDGNVKMSITYEEGDTMIYNDIDVYLYEWHDYCLTFNDSNIIAYIDGALVQTYDTPSVNKTGSPYFHMLCSEKKRYNIGTVSGVILSYDVFGINDVLSIHLDHTLPTTDNIYVMGSRLTSSFADLLFYPQQRRSGGIYISPDSMGTPQIGEGCYDDAENEFSMKDLNQNPTTIINATTITDIGDSVYIDNNYIYLTANGSLDIGTIDTNNYAFIKIEIDILGDAVLQFEYEDQWYNGTSIYSSKYTHGYSLYLPYFLLGSETHLRLINMNSFNITDIDVTTSTKQYMGNATDDVFIREIRIYKESCDSSKNGWFCSKDRSCGKCVGSICETVENGCSKTYSFKSVTLPTGEVSSLSFNSSENEDQTLQTNTLNGVSSIQQSVDKVLSTTTSTIYFEHNNQVQLHDNGNIEIPSGFGRFTNEYTLALTIKLTNSTSRIFRGSNELKTLNTLDITISNSYIELYPHELTSTKQIPINKWIKFVIRVSNDTISIACDGVMVLEASNIYFKDYLSATTLQASTIDISQPFSLAGYQIYPISVIDNELRYLSTNQAIIENTCDECLLPGICVGTSCYYPYDSTCPFYCKTCVDGKCTECLEGFVNDGTCSKCLDNVEGDQCDVCSSGRYNYPNCNSLALLISLIVVVVVIILLIILIIALFFGWRLYKIQQWKKRQLSEVEMTTTAPEKSVLLKDAKKKKVVIGNETLIEMGEWLYISKSRLDFGLKGKEPNVEQSLLDTLVLKNKSTKKLVVWVQLPKKDKFFLESDVEKRIMNAKEQLDIHFEIKLLCSCTCKENVIIKIENVDSKEVVTGKVPLSVSSYQSHKIDFDEIELVQPPIGDGSFGVVYKGFYKGREVAVKKLKARADKDGVLEEFQKEIDVMIRLHGPYIVEFVGACYLPDKMCIASDFAHFGSLGSLLRKQKFSYEQKVKFMLDCARGMKMMHLNMVIHRDLKPDNLLMFNISDVNPSIVNCKITDFGTSRAIQDFEQNYTSGIGTPVYMAPELLRKTPYNTPVDVFSNSIMMYEVFNQERPYTTEIFKMPWDIVKFILAGSRLERKADMSDGWWRCIDEGWQEDPNKRITFQEIVDVLYGELIPLNPAFEDQMKKEQHIKNVEAAQKDSLQNTNVGTTTDFTLSSNTTDMIGKESVNIEGNDTVRTNFEGDQTGLSKFINTNTSDFDIN
ncbi:Serine-threonine protein kinase [Entamoeba marina]